MTTGDRVTFDTNILSYALDSDGGEKHTIAAGLLRSARGGQCALLLQSLAELYNALRKRPGISSSKAQEFIEKNMEVFPVVRLDRSDLLPAIALHQVHQMHFWDALLITAARRAGCTLFLSEDGHHGQSFGRLQVLNPFLVSKSEVAGIFGA